MLGFGSVKILAVGCVVLCDLSCASKQKEKQCNKSGKCDEISVCKVRFKKFGVSACR